MKEESIKEARKILIERILNSDINNQDKLELCICMHHFLQVEDYEDNKKALQKVLNNKKWK